MTTAWVISRLGHRSLRGALRMNSSSFSENLPKREYEEIKFNVPWGHVSGKWYGPRNVRPIVGLHGWKDNAGSFDTLAPLLPPNVAFFAIDLPGHGLSSWLPDGCSYHALDYITLMLRMLREFKWDKISMICHSMSAINGFTFCSLFPDKCDMLIGFDVLKPLARSTDYIINTMVADIETFQKVNERSRSKEEPPCFKFEELIERLHQVTDRSIDKDSCKYILKRGTKASKKVPSKFYNSQDSRLKSFMFYNLRHDIIMQMAQKITAPYLFIKATDAPIYEKKEYHDEAINVLKQNGTFENYLVEGTHHVHLNEPKKVADIINPFILKYRQK